MNNVLLRPAIADDCAYILDLEERVMKEFAVALWGRWIPRPATDPVRFDRHRIIEVSGSRAGCLETINEVDHRVIKKLYIEPTFQGMGVGGYILDQCISSHETESMPTRLTVLVTNPAVEFYKRHGFEVESKDAERWSMLKRLSSR